MAGTPTARAGCGARRRPRRPQCRPPSSPRHGWRPPRPRVGGRRPYGSAPAADLRGRPARLPDVSRAHADHRVHHPSLGDRPDPRAPPRPRRDGGPRRRTESAVDPHHRHRAPRDDPPRLTRPAAPHPDAPPTGGDVRRARPFHRGRPIGPRGDWAPTGNAGPHGVGDRAGRSPDTRPTLQRVHRQSAGCRRLGLGPR